MCEKKKIVKARRPSEKPGPGRLPRLPCPPKFGHAHGQFTAGQFDAALSRAGIALVADMRTLLAFVVLTTVVCAAPVDENMGIIKRILELVEAESRQSASEYRATLWTVVSHAPMRSSQ